MNNDTIIAICTPPGTGAIALIRISGPKAVEIAGNFTCSQSLSAPQNNRRALLREIYDADGNTIDQVIITIYRAPASFTGEDVVEIACHGSSWIQRAILERAIELGAVPAGGGDFSLRAFLNGKIDMAQAEGIADLIASRSKMQQRMAMTQVKGHFSEKIKTLTSQLLHAATLLELELDFSEEDVEFASREKLASEIAEIKQTIKQLSDSYRRGSAFREGIPVAIIGAPNAGKSTLLNRLAQDDKAIVSDIPGTTRDTIEATVTISGILFRFIDTAGLRLTDDTIEQMGIDRAYKAVSQAKIIIYLHDSTTTFTTLPTELIQHLSPDASLIIVPTKKDIAALDTTKIEYFVSEIPQALIHAPISSKTGEGIDQLIQTITHHADPMSEGEIIVSNARHYNALNKALEDICQCEKSIQNEETADFLAYHLRKAIDTLCELTGAITSDTILHNLFSSFCIGK